MGSKNQAGKGDRPRKVDRKKYGDNYERAFGHSGPKTGGKKR